MNGLSIVIPVLDESHKILRSLKEKLEAKGAEVIVVDDGSKKALPGSIKHGVNFGYGAAILTGVKQAKNEVIMTMDGDGQHRVEDVENLWQVWQIMEKGVGIDLLIGARKLKQEKWFRYLGRKLLNTFASILALHWLPDLNSGLRLFRKSIVAGYSPILCKTYSFTTSLTISMIADNYRVEWFPIKVLSRKHGESKVNLIRHGWITLYYILRNGIALRTRKLRGWLRSFRLWMIITGKGHCLQSTSKTTITRSRPSKTGGSTKTESKSQPDISSTHSTSTELKDTGISSEHSSNDTANSSKKS